MTDMRKPFVIPSERSESRDLYVKVLEAD